MARTLDPEFVHELPQFVDSRERGELLVDLVDLARTHEYRRREAQLEVHRDIVALRAVRSHFQWRSAGRPGATTAAIEVDADRARMEEALFRSGAIPPWLFDGEPLGLGIVAASERQSEPRLSVWAEPPVDCVAVGSPPRVIRFSDGFVLGADGQWREPEPGGDITLCQAHGTTIIRRHDAATLQADGNWNPAPRDPDCRPDVEA